MGQRLAWGKGWNGAKVSMRRMTPSKRMSPTLFFAIVSARFEFRLNSYFRQVRRSVSLHWYLSGHSVLHHVAGQALHRFLVFILCVTYLADVKLFFTLQRFHIC